MLYCKKKLIFYKKIKYKNLSRQTYFILIIDKTQLFELNHTDIRNYVNQITPIFVL